MAWGNKVNPGDRFCFRCSSKITLTSLHEEEVKREKRLCQRCHYRCRLQVKAKNEEALESRTMD